MQQTTGAERREFQRLRLDPPIPGTFASTSVQILEVGVLGARVQHEKPIDPVRGELHFQHGEHDIGMRCEIVRTVPPDRAKYAGSGYESGMRFVAAVGDSGDRLREMLAQLVVKALEVQHDSSATRLRLRVVDGDKTVRGVDAQFLSYRLENGAWRKRHVFLPEQPPVGFTVARGEDIEEMQRL